MSTVRQCHMIALLWSLILGTVAAQAAGVGAAPGAASPSDLKLALDLRPPALDEIYSPQQIAELLNRPLSDIEEVRVEGVRLEAISNADPAAVPAGLEALFWSIPNPAQAWRIFMPISTDRENPFADDVGSVVYSQPTALPARDPAMFP